MTQTCEVLILAAHPDDAEFGIAGTVARWTNEGIEFAHRNVTVYLPPEVTGASDGNNQEEYPDPGTTLDKKLLEAGAAAAAAVSQASEAERKLEK